LKVSKDYIFIVWVYAEKSMKVAIKRGFYMVTPISDSPIVTSTGILPVLK